MIATFTINLTHDLFIQIRNWLDTDAAQYSNTPILVASDGIPRIELFSGEKLVDTVEVAKYSKDDLNELLAEMGQVRNNDLTWDKIKSERTMSDAFATKNFSAYNEILKKEKEDEKQQK